MPGNTFSVVNLGCKVNRVEADSIKAALLGAGWEEAEGDADAVIVNTCTVTAEADRKTRKEVNRALGRNERATVLVTGCAAVVDPSAYESLSPRVRVVEKGAVVDECLRLSCDRVDAGVGNASAETACLHREAASAPVAPCGNDKPAEGCIHAPAVLRVGSGFPTRVGVKVQDGCDNACTFCIVHVARGKAVSAPFEKVSDEVAAYARADVREVVLTGIDLGAYSWDGLGLGDLVTRLRTVAPETRLRISSIEPHSLDDALLEALAAHDGMVCRHLHVPLQSGSDKVLRDMARRYTTRDYLDRISRLKEAVPSVSLSTDVIVGFPGETEDDFSRTVDVARAVGFSKMHLFRYSRRAGTPAAERSDQVPSEAKARRMDLLAAVASELRTADASSRIGSSERVLVESKGRGMSESYYEVLLPTGVEPGALIDVTFAGYNEKDGTLLI